MLKYVGSGFVRGYPARDLTAEEVRKFGKTKLLATGLYKEVKKKVTKKPAKQAEE